MENPNSLLDSFDGPPSIGLHLPSGTKARWTSPRPTAGSPPKRCAPTRPAAGRRPGRLAVRRPGTRRGRAATTHLIRENMLGMKRSTVLAALLPSGLIGGLGSAPAAAAAPAVPHPELDHVRNQFPVCHRTGPAGLPAADPTHRLRTLFVNGGGPNEQLTSFAEQSTRSQPPTAPTTTFWTSTRVGSATAALCSASRPRAPNRPSWPRQGKPSPAASRTCGPFPVRWTPGGVARLIGRHDHGIHTATIHCGVQGAGSGLGHPRPPHDRRGRA